MVVDDAVMIWKCVRVRDVDGGHLYARPPSLPLTPSDHDLVPVPFLDRGLGRGYRRELRKMRQGLKRPLALALAVDAWGSLENKRVRG